MKRSRLLICLSVMLILTGCSQEEIESEKAIFTITEAPKLIPFQPEAETPEEELELPCAYNYIEENRMPVLRNQEGANTCWAFAALSALESSMDEDVTETYSADHLINHNPFRSKFEDGGAYIVTMAYLLSWNGPVPEVEGAYEEEALAELVPSVHVQEVRQSEPKDYEAIKRFIYLYGGVESALYVDFDEYMTDSEYYNEENNSYCYTGEKISNHDIVIVGWDDDYASENFLGNVTSDGAFLCLNSWGENFGDSGIFYVSYEDVNIGGYGVVYSRIDPTDNYDRIYQSDLCGYTAQIGYQQETAWFANVYTAEEDSLLKAAGFYATGRDTKYELYFVREFEDENSFKERIFVCEGTLKDAGYYTIDFPEAMNIDAGKDFAIVVKIQTEDSEYPVAIECPVEGLSEKADITDGRGYLSFQGNHWEHVEATKNYNVCLKAYADIR